MLICAAGVSIHSYASPVSEQLATQFYNYNNVDALIQLDPIDPQKYKNYASNRVDMQVQGKVVPEFSKQQAAKEIEALYKNFVESRMNQIQRDATVLYKQEFSKYQTEESVMHQVSFDHSPQGSAILAKQQSKRVAVQSLQKNLVKDLAQDGQLQMGFGQALQAE